MAHRITRSRVAAARSRRVRCGVLTVLAMAHDALVTTRKELSAWEASPTTERSAALATALGAVADRLSEHLTEEERDVVPLIAAHITQDEWDHGGKVAFSKFTPKQRFTAMGEMLAVATPPEAARMLAGLPGPVKAVWRLVGRRRYRRFMADVLGPTSGRRRVPRV